MSKLFTHIQYIDLCVYIYISIDTYTHIFNAYQKMEYLSLSIKKGHNPQSINSTDVTLVSYFYPSMEFPCVTGSIWVEE